MPSPPPCSLLELLQTVINFSLFLILSYLFTNHVGLFVFLSFRLPGCKHPEGRIESDSNAHLPQNSAFCLAHSAYSKPFLKRQSYVASILLDLGIRDEQHLASAMASTIITGREIEEWREIRMCE